MFVPTRKFRRTSITEDFHPLKYTLFTSRSEWEKKSHGIQHLNDQVKDQIWYNYGSHPRSALLALVVFSMLDF